MNFRIPWKPVAKGSFSHLSEQPFFVHRTLAYLARPEPFFQPFLDEARLDRIGSRPFAWQSLTIGVAGLDVAAFSVDGSTFT